jgi:hypothetical protein
MGTTPAFDLALFADSSAPQNPGDGVVVANLGPPLGVRYAPLVQATTPGVSVAASVPKATQTNQIMVSGSGPDYPWGLTVNPAVAASVPPPTAMNHTLLSDGTLKWQESTLAALLAAGNAVVTNAGALYTFDATSVIAFTASANLATRLDGGNSAKSQIDNFSIDAGTF